ncbi:MAG: hypothetical protein LCI00_30225 [Chloroflexi bacterium]|nr:hypothetical protein [Chloroflexota bacterium]MCC6892844.1 hypothetical protein [Anaerolineae bacterium]
MNKPLTTLQHLRRTWPIFASVGLILYWWLIAQVITPRIITFNSVENVDYWSLISLSGNKSVFVYLIALILFIGLGSLTGIYAWHYYGKLLRIGSWLLIAIAVFSSIGVGLYVLVLGLGTGTTLEHVQSMTFNGQVYQLATLIEHHDDFNAASYIVFECDAVGNTCDQLEAFPIDPPINDEPAVLTVNEEATLDLQQGSRLTQIKP